MIFASSIVGNEFVSRYNSTCKSRKDEICGLQRMLEVEARGKESRNKETKTSKTPKLHEVP